MIIDFNEFINKRKDPAELDEDSRFCVALVNRAMSAIVDGEADKFSEQRETLQQYYGYGEGSPFDFFTMGVILGSEQTARLIRDIEESPKE